MSTFACAAVSARVPRIGPDVMTGEHIRIRFLAEAMERDIACTSFRLRLGYGQRVVLVEHQPHRGAALHRGAEGVEQGGGGRLLQAQVVDGDVEGLRRTVEEPCDALRHRVGILAAVGEEVEVEGPYRASAFGSPVCSRGRSVTRTGSGRVAISAASSGSSVSVISFRSSGAIAPDASTWSLSQSRSPLQYCVPNRTIGKCSILPVWASVSDSKSSSRVPKPPGKMTKPRAYLTNMFLRTKK